MRQNKPFIIVCRVLFTLIVVGIVGFIFYHSSRIGEVSSGFSLGVTDKLNGLLARLHLPWQLSHLQVRKLGHLAEYMLLGFWLMLCLRVYTKRILAFVAWPLLGSLLIAVGDEFLQGFIAGRSSQVSDVLIDFAGICAGVAAALVLMLLLRLITSPLRRKQAA